MELNNTGTRGRYNLQWEQVGKSRALVGQVSSQGVQEPMVLSRTVKGRLAPHRVRPEPRGRFHAPGRGIPTKGTQAGRIPKQALRNRVAGEAESIIRQGSKLGQRAGRVL